MRRFKLACLALCLPALAGCGDADTQIAALARDALRGLVQPDAPAPPPLRQRLTPQVLAEIGQPILIVESIERETEAGAQLVRRTAETETWSTLDGIQFTFRDGVLIATRGLAGDLMSADLSEVLPALARGGQGAVRVHRYLNGLEQEEPRALVCDYRRAGRERITVLTGTYTTTRVDETCVSSSERIENRYWIDTGGQMRRSRQWVGPFAGSILFERIND